MTQTDSKETALDVMARIKRNSREREFCLAVLDLWANVQAQGIEIESVDKFGYDPKRLTNADKAKAARSPLHAGRLEPRPLRRAAPQWQPSPQGIQLCPSPRWHDHDPGSHAQGSIRR